VYKITAPDGTPANPMVIGMLTSGDRNLDPFWADMRANYIIEVAR
jgi:hypothetical protein